MTPGAAGSLRWAEVDLGALQHNVGQIRKLLAKETGLMAMVKANGYGHGLLLAARGAVDGGAEWLGVYHGDEALALRQEGFQQPLLVVGATSAQTLPALIGADVDVAVIDPAELVEIENAATAARRRARVHLKIDTGLNRLGVRPDAIGDLAAALRRAREHLEVAGIFTHFAAADAPELTFTREQHALFLQAVEVLHELAPGALLHCAGSGAILRAPETHHDLVRLGLAMYGYAPAHTQPPPLRIAMRVYARVVQVKTIAAGETVGYGRSWTAPAARRIATVALGYGQGLPRYLSNRGKVVVHGAPCPIVGIVSMDQVGVDVSEHAGVQAGDDAMLIGANGEVRVGADDIAAIGGTLPHEVICGISQSVPRIAVDATLRT